MVFFKIGSYGPGLIEEDRLDRIVGFITSHPRHSFGLYLPIPGCRLSGGRKNLLSKKNELLYKNDRYGTQTRYGEFDEVIDTLIANIISLSAMGISIDVALTNHTVDQEDLNDTLLRRFLDTLAELNQIHNVGNGVIYVNNNLRDFVKENYGFALKTTASVIKFYNEHPGYTYQQGLAENDRVVIMHQDIREREVLRGIPQHRRKDAYIMENTWCKSDCTPEIASQHYKGMSKLNRGETAEGPQGCNCNGNRTNPTIEDLRWLINMGFTSMKIGRHYDKSGITQLEEDICIFDNFV